MNFNRIVPWRVMMNPIKFYDDIISDVISGDIALWACEHDNLTNFHPISTKLGMVDGIWVQTNPIEKRLYLFILYSNNSIAEGLRRPQRLWFTFTFQARRF